MKDVTVASAIHTTDPWLHGEGESLDDVFSVPNPDAYRTHNNAYHDARQQGAPVTEHANLAAALAAFQAEMPVVAKNQKANVPMKGGGSYSYTYAGLPDVSAVVMPLLTQHGLAFSVCPRVTEHGGEVAGVLLHTSGEKLEASLPLFGRQAQEIGSSLTYARRYLLGCMTGVVTDDDDDGSIAQSARRTEKPMTAKTRGQMFALFSQKGIAEDQQLAGINNATGGNYTSRGDLSETDALAVIETLRKRPDAPVDAADDHAQAVAAQDGAAQ